MSVTALENLFVLDYYLDKKIPDYYEIHNLEINKFIRLFLSAIIYDYRTKGETSFGKPALV